MDPQTDVNLLIRPGIRFDILHLVFLRKVAKFRRSSLNGFILLYNLIVIKELLNLLPRGRFYLIQCNSIKQLAIFISCKTFFLII